MEVAAAGEEEEEEEEAEADWLLPESAGEDEERRRLGAAGGGIPSPRGKVGSARICRPRIVVHLDLDCFYAQVEMIYNPELRNKPLGVLQKYLVVTCNYEARNFGVTKCMLVKTAKEKCPELVLVNGEDLTKYREISYKVTALLEEFSPLVERLGFDENFVDVTEMVEEKLKHREKDTFSTICVSGHVYNNQTVDLCDPIHLRLAVGSQIAAEMREALRSKLGLTGCAGVAQNKLLSKLVSGIFKPNQQTVLLPESKQDLMVSLNEIQRLPGIGFKTSNRLALLGLTTVRDLQAYPAAILEKQLGTSVAQHVQKLSWGEDDSPVTPSGAPQSLSDEDSFKKCSSEEEVRKKVEGLLVNLLNRINKDGRKPHTIRLTLRQFSQTNKWFNRESRQCPIPLHIVQKMGTGDESIKVHLVDILMKLFHKMINVRVPFHLTLLSVCFSNLKETPPSTKQSIRFYLTPSSPSSHSAKLIHKMEEKSMESMSDEQPNYGAGDAEDIQAPQENADLPKNPGILGFPFQSLPAGIDCDVFNQLPRDIKEEILSTQMKGRYDQLAAGDMVLEKTPEPSAGLLYSGSSCPHIGLAIPHGNSSTNEKPPLTKYECSLKGFTTPYNPVEVIRNKLTPEPTGSLCETNQSSVSRFLSPQTCIPEENRHLSQKARSKGSASGLPSNIDPKTFSELPTEMQEELLKAWKSQDPVSKARPSKNHEKLKRKKKGLPLPPQSNSLLSYFKPG